MFAKIHYEITFNEVERAKKFYMDLVGWKVQKSSGNGLLDDPNSRRSAWVMWKRQQPDQKIVDYFGVSSVSDSSAKVVKLGGKILMPKMAVPKMGYFAVCMDTEGNVFGLWEADPQAE